jgi:orotidine-5'-phosphate decarboxylase
LLLIWVQILLLHFWEFEDKWAIVLALTSNKGGLDFQKIESKTGKQLFEQVLETSKDWGTDKNMMYVVGATRVEELLEIRAIVPNHFLLVPGVGAQGGNLKDVSKYGLNTDCGLLVNSSRGIIYAGNDIDFAIKAKVEAQKLQQEMAVILSEAGL